MEREIKFRGKTLHQHNHEGKVITAGSWIYGYLYKYHQYHRIIMEAYFQSQVAYDVDPNSIGQYTGLKDMNGKEIFEGDIIVVKGQYPRIVLWDKICWALMPTEHYNDNIHWIMNIQHPDSDWWEDYAKEIEVIGNLYDNPINKK